MKFELGLEDSWGYIMTKGNQNPMRKLYGDNVTSAETYLTLHSRKDVDGKNYFMDDRAAQQYTGYYTTLAACDAAGLGGDESSSSGSTVAINDQVWAEVVSIGRKKRSGRVFGFEDTGAELLGIPSRRRRAGQTHFTIGLESSSSLGSTPEEVQAMIDAKLAEERARVAQERDEEKLEMQNQLQSLQTTLTQQPLMFPTQPLQTSFYPQFQSQFLQASPSGTPYIPQQLQTQSGSTSQSRPKFNLAE